MWMLHRSMTLLEFQGTFPTDDACRNHLFAMRWPEGTVIFAVFGLAVLCTAVAYVLYFSLIRSVGPVKTVSVTFLVPVFGVIWGALFLREAITLNVVLGLTVILISVGLVMGTPPFRKKRPVEQVPSAE